MLFDAYLSRSPYIDYKMARELRSRYFVLGTFWPIFHKLKKLVKIPNASLQGSFSYKIQGFKLSRSR